MCPLVRITLQSNCLVTMLYRTLHNNLFLFLQKDLQLLENSSHHLWSVVMGWMDGMQSNSKSNPLGWVNETLDVLH